MNDEAPDTEVSQWYSTYGLLTSKRILERLNIYLENDELISAIKNPLSVYYQLLKVPLKNVFNGIILQQVYDYQVYAQKLFIDYLLSGEGSKDEESAGANTREDLELERTKLVEIGDGFNHQEVLHQNLIAESQASLIKISNAMQSSLQVAAKKIRQILGVQGISKEELLIQRAIRVAMIHYAHIDDETLASSSSFWGRMAGVLDTDLNNSLNQQLAVVLSAFGDPRKEIEKLLATYLEQTEEIKANLCGYRSQLFELILKTTDSIKLLPDYRVDEAKEQENRSSLYFDSHIGD